MDLITWNKGKIGMGYRTRRIGEYLVVLQKPPIKAKVTWTEHNIPDVWDEKIKKIHPHSKPIGLQSALLKATTKDGDIICDPCAGGYSVLEASKNFNVVFIGSNLE